MTDCEGKHLNILLAGGTGFVGRHLTAQLTKARHQVFILTRHPQSYTSTEQIHYLPWLQPQQYPEQQLPAIDVVFNLAGESLNSGRWTAKRKQRMLNSRITTTQEIIRIIAALDNRPQVLINASAVGYYGMSETDTFTEQSISTADDFLANIVQQWEHEASQATRLGVRTTLARFGVILGEEGALPKMVLPYKIGVGGTIGSGQQWLSWIHIQDVVGLLMFMMEHESITGPVNITAPGAERMTDFGRTIADVLHRPHWLPMPSFMMKLALGEMSQLLLQGQHVQPEKAKNLGYVYKHPRLKTALSDLLTTS